LPQGNQLLTGTHLFSLVRAHKTPLAFTLIPYNEKHMTILIIHHVQDNTLGSLEAVLDARKLPYRYQFCRQLTERDVELDQASGLILLGGKESAADEHRHAFMKPEQQLIRNAIGQNLPVFGICLGAQMIARSLGAIVEKNKFAGQDYKEIGWTPIELTEAGKCDPVLEHLDQAAQFQWHEDTYHLPPGGIQLARSQWCLQQAFKLNAAGNKTYGVQFHPEVTLHVIRAWLDASKSLEPNRANAIWEESQQNLARWNAASYRMFDTFCEIVF
jgi:GMP synthase (glutamine-hydrolysing)